MEQYHSYYKIFDIIYTSYTTSFEVEFCSQNKHNGLTKYIELTLLVSSCGYKSGAHSFVFICLCLVYCYLFIITRKQYEIKQLTHAFPWFLFSLCCYP